MPRRVFARSLTLVACLAVALGAAACGDSSSTKKPNPKTSNAPVSSGQKTLPAKPSGPEQVVYYLVSDSSGWKPSADSTISLIFEPKGRAVLYAASPTDQLAHHGTWSYSGGSLTLKFGAADFKPDATFKLDLAATTATMPFQVSDPAKGTSTWMRGSMSHISKAFAVFNAAATDPDLKISPDAAVAEAIEVVKSMAAAPGVDVGPLAAAPNRDLALLAGRGVDGTEPIRLAADEPEPPKIKEVSALPNGVHVEYEDAPAVDVLLYDFAANPASPAALTDSPIRSDPRVRINVEKPGNGKDDPRVKRAVFIAPFATGRFYGNIWTSMAPTGVSSFLGLETGEQKPSRGFNWAQDESKLRGVGYEVEKTMDADATLYRIVGLLGGRSFTAPGVVIFNTHGSTKGNLATGVNLGKVSDPATVDANFAKAIAEIQSTTPDLVTFDGGTAVAPKTISKMALARDGAPGVSDFFLALTPDFWKWLASHNVKFDRSLVYIAACSTDATPALREAIAAKAYFGWTKEVNPLLAGAVANYLVDDMVRPNHTAEEAYYNIFRIVSTRQRIYDEDKDLDQAVPGGFDKSVAFLDHFHGYGWDGSKLVPYMNSGWLDRVMNPGNVWWTVFAARWDKHAPDGAKELVRCNEKFWGDKKRPTMGEVFCTGATPGGTPTPDEVGYATYVLTGTELLPYSKTKVPRLTLADG